MQRWSIADPDDTDSVTVAASVLLRGGGIVAIPTETFYGLAALASDEDALRRLVALKGARGDKPFPLLVEGTSAAVALARARREPLERLSDRFWPGPLTIVFPGLRGLPAALTRPDGAVAARQSPHPFLADLLDRLGEPITATSANRSGAPAPAAAADIDSRLERSLDGIVDGGATSGGRPSTILDITGERPRILRAGAVRRGELESVLAIRLV